MLAIWEVDSPEVEVAAAPAPLLDPPAIPTAAPAPSAAATTAVAVRPSACLARCRRGGSGTGYAPPGP